MKQKKLKVSKTKTSKPKKKILKEKKNISNEPLNKSIDKTKKCKRGSKHCKNSICDSLMPIHTKKCIKCGFEQEIKKSNKIPKSSSDNFKKEIDKLSTKIALDPKKNMNQAFSLKKKILFKNEFNSTYYKEKIKNLNENFQNRIIKISSDIIDGNTNLNYDFNLRSQININTNPNNNEIIKLKHLDVFTDLKNETNFINIGFPITDMSWAPRYESNFEYLAIAVSNCEINLNSNDKLNDLSIKYLNLSYLNLYDNKNNYDHDINKSGFIYIYRLNNEENNYIELYYIIELLEGSAVNIKWSPIYSNNENEIGLLGIVVNKKLKIISIPIISKNNEKKLIKLEPILTIEIPKTKIICFDWSYNKNNDLLLIGDYNGNIYMIKILENNKYQIINTYFQAHNSEITDIKFFPLNTDNLIMFGSTSYDGFLKIFDNLNKEIPLYESQLSKTKIFNLFWDYGGKYIIANREGTSPSSLLISFFSIQKISKMNIQLSEKNKLMHIDSFPPPEFKFDSFTQTNSNPYNNYVYFTDSQGYVLIANGEYLRKASSKKKKKNEKEYNYNLKLLMKIDYNQEKNSYEIYNDINDLKKNKIIEQKTLNFNNSIKTLAVNPNKLYQDMVAVGSLGGLVVIKMNK